VARLSVLAWIGNAAARLFGNHGDVAQQAQTANCSRQTVYDHADKVQRAVADAQRPGPSRENLLQELGQLKDENRQLWEALENSFECPKAKRQQFAVTAAAMGLSSQQTLVLLTILLRVCLVPGRSTLARWVQQGARKAGRILEVLDAVARPLVLCLCVDEIFFRRKPVLMGIEPHSMAWVLGQRAADRSGPTWAKALAAWPALQDVAADGGSGIELGLKLTAKKRQEEAEKAQKRQQQATEEQPKEAQAETAPIQVTPLRVRLDVFHIRQEGERALRTTWGRAEPLWEQAEKLSRAKNRFDRGGTDRRGFKKSEVAKAWALAEAAFHEADRQEQAWQRAVAALAVFRPDGCLNDRTWAEAELRGATAELNAPHWAKTKRMLLDPRALCFLDRLHEDLAVAEPCPERRAALVALWQGRRAWQCPDEEMPAAWAELKPLWQSLVRQRLGEGWPQAYRRVSRVLQQVLRASSAVECVNSVVRMHQSRHRNLSQPLLDLKRLYWNLRSFVSGKRRGRCPYEHLGLKLPTYDPWVLLQMDPEELKQKLSSSGVAI
jgi:hypothetical protein